MWYLRVLTSSVKNKWYHSLLLVPLPFVCTFIKTSRLLPARTMSSIFPMFDATVKDHWNVSTAILPRWNFYPHNVSHQKPGRNRRARGSLSALISGRLCKSSDIPAVQYKIPCVLLGAGTAIFRAHVVFLRCLMVRGMAHTSLFLAIHSLLPKVKRCIIYITSSVARILSEGWCCADVLEIQGELKNNHSASMTIFVARKAINLKEQLIEWYIVRGEVTLLGTVLPEESDEDIPMII